MLPKSNPYCLVAQVNYVKKTFSLCEDFEMKGDKDTINAVRFIAMILKFNWLIYKNCKVPKNSGK